MVDIEKLSGLSGSEKEDTGINVLDAIKGVTQLIQEAKGLQKNFSPQQDQQPRQIEQAKPVNVEKAPVQSVQMQQAKPTENKLQDLNNYWDKGMQAIDLGIVVYGDIPVSEFKRKLEEDKPRILTMLRGML